MAYPTAPAARCRWHYKWERSPQVVNQTPDAGIGLTPRMGLPLGGGQEAQDDPSQCHSIATRFRYGKDSNDERGKPQDESS